MKKTKILIALTIVLVLLILSFVLLLANYNVYELSPIMCEVMLGSDVTPKSFVSSQGEGTMIENAYTYAKVNGEGNLVLILTNNERNEWKNQEVVLQILSRKWQDKKDIGVDIIEQEALVQVAIIEQGLSCGLEISEDYKTVIAEPSDDAFYYQWFVLMGIQMQFFEGVPSDEISVEYIQYADNGSIAKKLIWPKDDAIIWPNE